jgi:poly(A) polymerase Pap1
LKVTFLKRLEIEKREKKNKIDLSELFSKAQWHRKYIHYSELMALTVYLF